LPALPAGSEVIPRPIGSFFKRNSHKDTRRVRLLKWNLGEKRLEYETWKASLNRKMKLLVRHFCKIGGSVLGTSSMGNTFMHLNTDRRSFLRQTTLFGTGAWLAGYSSSAARGDTEAFTLEEFAKLHQQLRPSPDELWRTIPWRMEIVEACQEAATAKKPLVLRVRSGHPLGCV
jgi:hypothetical protein